MYMMRTLLCRRRGEMEPKGIYVTVAEKKFHIKKECTGVAAARGILVRDVCGIFTSSGGVKVRDLLGRARSFVVLPSPLHVNVFA